MNAIVAKKNILLTTISVKNQSKKRREYSTETDTKTDALLILFDVYAQVLLPLSLVSCSEFNLIYFFFKNITVSADYSTAPKLKNSFIFKNLGSGG
jgi:hypothetical protein